MTVYSKPAMTPAELIDQWKTRGLLVSDEGEAARYLEVISYYRLSAYTLPFQVPSPNHYFKSGTDFNDVLDLYVFDRQLRLLLLDAIERIEVALRSFINNFMSLKYGHHWYIDLALFTRQGDYGNLIDDLRRQCNRQTKDVFLQHYFDTYSEPDLPPSWVMTEIISFGQLSKLFANIKDNQERKIIAQKFNTTAILLESWMQSITYIRNVCAHHSRLWNRELSNSPRVPRTRHQVNGAWIKMPIALDDTNINPLRRSYILLVIIEKLLRTVNPGSTWHKRLYRLLFDHPNISISHMGMPKSWHEDPFWRLDDG